MPTIGGSVFVRNAIALDYCIEESLMSILELDDIVVLDCQSTDGTTEMLRALSAKHPKIRLIENVTWECADNYDRLKILANQAIGHLDTDWHFMIQADEVLHEDAIPAMRQVVESSKAFLSSSASAFLCRRINLFGNIDHHIRYDLPVTRKPVSDLVVRLGTKGTFATGDAESLTPVNYDCNHADRITLVHYGFVRKNQKQIDKVMSMQSWFHGKGSQPDQRVVDMKNKDNVYRPEAFFQWSELCPLMISHPKVAKAWVDERRAEYPTCPGGCFGIHP